MAGVLGYVTWLLTDQRYRQFLTEQLSTMVNAEVQVGTAHITVWPRLGIELDEVTIREYAATTPFFTASTIDVLLDLSALLQGQFDFRHIVVIRPHLQVIAGVTQEALLQRLRQGTQQRQRTQQESEGWFSPRFTLQHLTIRNGTLTYRSAQSPTPLSVHVVDAVLTYPEGGAVTLDLKATLGPDGTLGTCSLSTRTREGNGELPLSQRRWQGQITVTDTHLHALGQQLGKAWPQAVLGFTGQYEGQWHGPVALTGDVDIREGSQEAYHLRRGRIRLEKVTWSGFPSQPTASRWASALSTLVVTARIQTLQGVVGKSAFPLALDHGQITFDNKTLTIKNLRGHLGTGSQLLDATVKVTQLFSTGKPQLTLQVVAQLDIAKEARTVLSLLPASHSTHPIPEIQQAHGSIRVHLHAQSELGRSLPLQYAAEAVIHNASLQLPTQNVAITHLNGTVTLTPDTLATSQLTGRVDAAPVTLRGTIQHYRSAQRQGTAQITFSDLSDRILMSLFPDNILLANEGAVSGTVTFTLSPGKKVQTAGTLEVRDIQLDPLRFLHPFIISSGTLNWQGQRGSFIASKGQLVHFPFTGRGHFTSLSPLRIELSLDFAKLDVLQAIALDPPRPAPASPTPQTVVKATLTCGECSYKTAHATNLHLAIHWHDRQAEVDVVSAHMAGGVVRGDVTVWPDLGALFFAPHVSEVNVQRFFHMLGNPSDVLTGAVSGSGKIYVGNWRRWAHPADWDAILSLRIADGVARQVPILVQLWSAVSLQGVLRLQAPELPSSGLPFSTLTGELAFGRGTAVTKNVSLNGSAVRIEAPGEMNLHAQTVDLLVQLVLLHGVTSTLEWVPLVGELLARGTDMLTTLPFRVTGPYADPTVTPAFVNVG